MKIIRNTLALLAFLSFSFPSFAQEGKTGSDDSNSNVHYIHRETVDDIASHNAKVSNAIVYVNDLITTHLIMPELVKVVDISSDKLVGNQLSDNIVRIKPSKRMMDNEILGTVTIVGERHIAQLDVVFVKGPAKANSVYNVQMGSLIPYENPDISMPMSEMSRYAWAIYGQPQRYHKIHRKAYGIQAFVNNIYSIGDYFFIDFSLYNKTNIKYDIEEIRVRLSDKKETKATNSQTIELTPVYTLNKSHSFQRAYRNVLVLNRLTFPDEKVLTLEISENQISGRVITIPIEYSDILSADGFSEELLQELDRTSR